ncbi:MAG: hypothetical protein AAGB16_02805, partial [Pseudomonadota bacterium]
VLLSGLVKWWRKASPDLRLVVGTILVIMIGLAGLTPNYFGFTLSWPFAALIAAIGWGAGGIAARPMIILILFGFAQDVSMIFAPLGVFALLNLAVFGLSAALYQTFDAERSSGAAMVIPLSCLLAGFSLLWVIASLTNGNAVRLEPVFLSFLSTIALYVLIAPVFDLGRRPDERGQLS